jgi:hypothetical protein
MGVMQSDTQPYEAGEREPEHELEVARPAPRPRVRQKHLVGDVQVAVDRPLPPRRAKTRNKNDAVFLCSFVNAVLWTSWFCDCTQCVACFHVLRALVTAFNATNPCPLLVSGGMICAVFGR